MFRSTLLCFAVSFSLAKPSNHLLNQSHGTLLQEGSIVIVTRRSLSTHFEALTQAVTSLRNTTLLFEPQPVAESL